MTRGDAEGRGDAEMHDEQKLPVTPGQAYDGEGADGAEGAVFESDGGPHPEVEEVPSWRLVTTLAVAGALAGLLIVAVYQWAQPQILANRAEVIRTAVQEVLASPDHVETLYVVDGSLSETPPAGVDTAQAERVFLGFDQGGAPVGFAVMGEKPGFQDVISLMFGYDPGADEVLGMRVLESKETPGLGDKIYKDSAFVAEFNEVGAPLVGVKGEGTGANEVDMITGATISSTAVIDIINARIEALGAALDAYMTREGGTP